VVTQTTLAIWFDESTLPIFVLLLIAQFHSSKSLCCFLRVPRRRRGAPAEARVRDAAGVQPGRWGATTGDSAGADTQSALGHLGDILGHVHGRAGGGVLGGVVGFARGTYDPSACP